jgi:hypothetical protein
MNVNFINNKYLRWYISIVSRPRWTSEPIERHHVIPRSMGGVVTVNLTLKEHFLCHWLLTKFTRGDDLQKMRRALSMMRKGRSLSSWQYEVTRKAAILAGRNRTVSQETRTKMSLIAQSRTGHLNPFFGRKHTPETRLKLSRSKSGSNNHFYGTKRPDHSETMKVVMRGKAKSESHKQSISASWQSSRARVSCPHCKAITTKAMHTRWHGARCRAREEN